MPFATSAGVELYYEDTGAGDAIVFVHEFSGDCRSWEPQVRHFSRRYRCITFNARGYPPSEVPQQLEAYSQDLAVADILSVVDHLEIAEAHVVGVSMGGFAALHFGLQHPERAASLVVAACGYGATPVPGGYARWQAEADGFASEFDGNDVESTWDVHANAPGRIPFKDKDPRGWQEFAAGLLEHPSVAAAHTLRGVQRNRPNLYDLGEELRALTVPTLILNGDEDDACLEPGVYLKRSIPSAALCTLPKTGHTINLEEPALFNQMTGDFFATVRSGRWRTHALGSPGADTMGHGAVRAERADS